MCAGLYGRPVYRDTWLMQYHGKATKLRPLLVAPKGGRGLRLRDPVLQVAAPSILPRGKAGMEMSNDSLLPLVWLYIYGLSERLGTQAIPKCHVWSRAKQLLCRYILMNYVTTHASYTESSTDHQQKSILGSNIYFLRVCC